ncbi:MAG TPA: SIR2 family protein [Saprospiraceae bacterium]|nr:SIR2 family protein [Saprospiraceae bacterium]
MEYLNIDRFITSAKNRLKRKKCVLFLGPRFGETDQGKTASETIREMLADREDIIHNLDEEFDNLFILKDAKQSQVFELQGMLATYYSDMQPGDIYKTIAQLPFRAVICCTPDLMLKKAYESLGMTVDFHYYSHKGQEETDIKDDPDTRVVYNLFGTAENDETLIVTYEAFFRFVVNLLSSGDRLPGALHHIFQDAEMFMLLGFDLNKWYVPLIVRKLNERQGSIDTSRTSILTLDTTFRPEAEQRLSTTLIVVENQTDVVLKRISEAMSDQAPQPQPGVDKEKLAPETLKNILDGVVEYIGNDNLIQAFQLLMSNADHLALDQNNRSNMWLLQRRAMSAKQSFASDLISYREMNTELANVSKAILDLVEALRKTIPASPNN